MNPDWPAEREALLRQVRDLQAELDDVTPLRRHLLLEARSRLGGLDRRVQQRLAAPVVRTPPELLPGESAQDYDARALDALRAGALGSPALERYQRVSGRAGETARRTAKRLLGR